MTDTSPEDILAKIRAQRAVREQRKASALPPLPPQREYEGQGLTDRLWDEQDDRDKWVPSGFWFAILAVAIIIIGGVWALWEALQLGAAGITALAELLSGWL